MSTFTPASEIILRHSDEWEDRRILFAGDLQDNLPAQLTIRSGRAYTQQYHHWRRLSAIMGDNARFGLAADADTVSGCDTLIYYWPKNRQEAQFQLQNLLSLLPSGCDIFITGENRSGVRSTENILAGWAPVKKIDSARRCGLYYGQLMQQPRFAVDDFWDQYTLDGCIIKTLPGIFSRDGLDAGSALLLSTLTSPVSGKVLDMGCGCGVLAAQLARHSPDIRLTLTDASAAAVAASKATLDANQLQGEVFVSDIWSDVSGCFDMIISNPPFHDGLQTSLTATRSLIRGAIKHLNDGGELRLVANAFLPWPEILDETFGQHEVIAQTGRFRVYRAVYRKYARKRS